jgi:hypothetical protein
MSTFTHLFFWALLISVPAKGDGLAHTTPLGNLPRNVTLPPFDPETATIAIQDILQKYKAGDGDDWREVEEEVGAEIPFWRRFDEPGFNRAKVDGAVSAIAKELNERPPTSWQELSRMMTKYNDVIPDRVVKDIIRGQVKDKEEKDKTEKPIAEARAPEGAAPAPTPRSDSGPAHADSGDRKIRRAENRSVPGFSAPRSIGASVPGGHAKSFRDANPALQWGGPEPGERRLAVDGFRADADASESLGPRRALAGFCCQCGPGKGERSGCGLGECGIGAERRGADGSGIRSQPGDCGWAGGGPHCGGSSREW